MNCNPLRQDSSRKGMCFVVMPFDNKRTYGTRFLAKRMHMACRCLRTDPQPVKWPHRCSESLLRFGLSELRSTEEGIWGGGGVFCIGFYGAEELTSTSKNTKLFEGVESKNLLRPMQQCTSLPRVKQNCARSLRGKGGIRRKTT